MHQTVLHEVNTNLQNYMVNWMETLELCMGSELNFIETNLKALDTILVWCMDMQLQ